MVSTVPRVQHIKEPQIYYERRLRDIFMTAADNHEGLIKTEEVWNYMLVLIIRQRLATITETEQLDKVRPSFPLKFETFINTIH